MNISAAELETLTDYHCRYTWQLFERGYISESEKNSSLKLAIRLGNEARKEIENEKADTV